MNVWNNTVRGARPKGYKAPNTAETPRTRSGQAFPGGKAMRRALKALSIRQNTFTPTMKPSGHACTKPGSMRGNV